jgi:hypothetical protein
LVEQSQSSGVSVEELVDRALTRFLEYEKFIRESQERVNKASIGK